MQSRPPHCRSQLYATITLPAMTAEQATLLFDVLGEVAAAIWDAYEPEISCIAAEEARLYEPDEDGHLDIDDLPF